jgi:hypothetical protein
MKKAIAAVGVALLVSGCIEKEKIVKIPDAENILFTEQGSLLISGGKSLFQVEQKFNEDGSSYYQAHDLYPDRDCAFGGIAQSGEWVFAVCKEIYVAWKGWTFGVVQDTHLFAAKDSKDLMHFQALDKDLSNDPLDSMVIPNGMDFSPSGDLIIADEDFFSDSSVGRIKLDYSGDFPKFSSFEADFIDTDYGISSPNGVQIEGNMLYVSDKNTVRRFHFDENGEVPLLFTNEHGEEVSNLPDDNLFYTGGIIVDDIMPYCGGIAVTHYLESKLVFQSASGEQYKTLPFSFESPTALAIGKGQGFDGNDLMVTEKGVLLETGSDIGNRLSRVPMDVDLHDPLTCQAINEME